MWFSPLSSTSFGPRFVCHAALLCTHRRWRGTDVGHSARQPLGKCNGERHLGTLRRCRCPLSGRIPRTGKRPGRFVRRFCAARADEHGEFLYSATRDTHAVDGRRRSAGPSRIRSGELRPYPGRGDPLQPSRCRHRRRGDKRISDRFHRSRPTRCRRDQYRNCFTEYREYRDHDQAVP